MSYLENILSWWRDGKKRSLLIQLFTFLLLLFLASVLINNTADALKKQGVASGFDFLNQEAAFAIGDSLIDYSAEDSFGKAILVGLLNTLIVALLGNALAILWGTFLGIAQLSSNWILSKLAKMYINALRNVPLLLQLFFWYALVTEMLPPVRNAIELFPYFFLSQRGMAFPFPHSHPVYTAMAIFSILGLTALLSIYWWQKNHQRETGQTFKYFWCALTLPLMLPLIVWIIGGFPLSFSVPQLQGFNFQGGKVLSPEFFALLTGLVSYTSAFIAEIVRSGIESIPKGQWEAARSLGLRPALVLRLVILPQALRVIIPPLTSQMLNLTKNSSLAVAIGYPDLVNVTNTTANQTGQAVECIAIIMAIYLTFSLMTSAFMNWYNQITRLAAK